MVLYGQLAVGLLYLGFLRVAVYAEYLVIIAFFSVGHNNILDNATSSDLKMRRCPLLKFDQFEITNSFSHPLAALTQAHKAQRRSKATI
jgi:hypothetical protein